MGVNYYKILGVDKEASDDDLNKAFKKLAMKWHPDPTDKREAEAKFKQISEAYDVLSDPQKRAVYDQYGEEGLKGGVPPPDAGGPGGATFFSRGGGRTSSSFNPRSADDKFSEFFGCSGPSGGMGDRTSSSFNPRSADNIFSEFFGCSGSSGGMGDSGMSGSGYGGTYGDSLFASFGEGDGGAGGSMHQPAPRKETPIENNLPCSLEELYKGTTKRMKIYREIVDANGKKSTKEDILTINIKTGWKKGTKITFPKRGNEKPGVIPADIVFIVDEKPHRVFTRDENDLVVKRKISLAEALTGYTVHLTTLDERNLAIRINNVIHPTYEEVVPGEGMPLPKDPSKKGNLRINFDIKFPSRMTASQKDVILMNF